MDHMDFTRLNHQDIDIEPLEKISREFFNTYGGKKLFGKLFFKDLAGSPGKDLFERLLARCGYENNMSGFFQTIVSMIGSQKRKTIQVNGTQLPSLYLYHLLETLVPGNRLYSVKTVDQLEKTAFVKTEDVLTLQAVMDQFPVRLSDHVIRQSLVSEGVAKQYLPFSGELDLAGHVITFDGHFKKGVLEQMYQNRVIFLLDMHCPVYCRFCFRKHKKKRKEKTPTPAEVMAAVDHVKADSNIREILITGGEPLLNKANLETALNGLMTIDHVQTIRIATRSIAYFPDLFLSDNSSYIQYLLDKNVQYLKHGKQIEIGVHFVHPDEVSIQSLSIISKLVQNGIQVYVQTPFLNGLNTNGETLGQLFGLLRQAGAKIYYIFTPCSPIHGTKEYWTPISKAIKALQYLRANVSDRCIPKLCTATSLGKIEWQTSGWAVEEDPFDKTHTWIRTPYTVSYFKAFIPDIKQMPDLRVNKEGTLDARFQVVMGDDALLAFNRPDRIKKDPWPVRSLKEIIKIRAELLTASRLSPSISPTPSRLISRAHKTRVEMEMGSGEDAFDYLTQNSDITDVVVYWENDADPDRINIRALMDRLTRVPHLACIRICDRQLSIRPGSVTDVWIEEISDWCNFSIGNPVRIEIETWFLLPEEILAAHRDVAEKLIQKGVNIYANVPLIRGVNDQPEIIVNLAHKLRQAKIEFHHLYVAGLTIQERFNSGCPVDSSTVIDIASRVRKDCSGRQIPLYIVQTPLGETDFGIKEVSEKP